MWAKIWDWIKSWFSKKEEVKPVPATTVWPSYRCDEYFRHGGGGENEMREAAIAACRDAKLDCIRCKAQNWNDEVAVHMLHFRSPVDNQFKLGSQNWYERAKAKGVTRYQIELSASQADRWNKLMVDYPADTVQFMTSDVSGVQAIIKDRPVVQLT